MAGRRSFAGPSVESTRTSSRLRGIASATLDPKTRPQGGPKVDAGASCDIKDYEDSCDVHLIPLYFSEFWTRQPGFRRPWPLRHGVLPRHWSRAVIASRR